MKPAGDPVHIRLMQHMICGLVLLSCIGSGFAAPELSQVRSDGGVVVSVCPLATKAGVEILESGGNAVDAAIAVEFALAVTWPEAGNIGGGGFMMVHPPAPPGGEPSVVCIDYREKAPLAAGRHTFTRDDGPWSHKIVGVPGTVAGMETAWRKYGRLPWHRLLEPAIRLARDGFVIDRPLSYSLNYVLGSPTVQSESRHEELLRNYGKRNEAGTLVPWQPGERLALPDLAATLTRIAGEGKEGFYSGTTARLIVDEMQRGDGLITMEDLDRYTAVVREPIVGSFMGYTVFGPPPPSSGGICLVQMLQVLEDLDIRSHAMDPWSADALHKMAETMKRAFRDRALHLGDTDFVPSHPRLITPEYAATVASGISMEKATPSASLAPPMLLSDESPQTTHFSVVDGDGMAVSNTTTLEASWGARIVVKGAGFVLNNEMGDFNWFPGETNTAGRIGTEANTIEPGKRMLSSQTPVIVSQGGSPVLVTGSPGGRTIINTVMEMVLYTLGYGMPLDKAMAAPRFHHQWFPDRLVIENRDGVVTGDAVDELRDRGHDVSVRSLAGFQGDAHSIMIDLKSGERHGVADFRRNGSAMAVSSSPAEP